MLHRAHQMGIQVKKKSVPKTEAIAWLKEHPVMDKEDIKFLRKEEARIYAVLEAAEGEALAIAKESWRMAANWTVKEPWLRLCLAIMVHDKARKHLVVKDDAWKRLNPGCA
jgi:hypothetical protein